MSTPISVFCTCGRQLDYSPIHDSLMVPPCPECLANARTLGAVEGEITAKEKKKKKKAKRSIKRKIPLKRQVALMVDTSGGVWATDYESDVLICTLNDVTLPCAILGATHGMGAAVNIVDCAFDLIKLDKTDDGDEQEYTLDVTNKGVPWMSITMEEDTNWTAPLSALSALPTLDVAQLATMLPFMSDNPSRMNLNGVRVENGAMVAVNGHVLAVEQIDYTGLSAIVSRQTINAAWEAGVKSLAIEKQGDALVVLSPDGGFKGRVIAEEYPNYKQVIPSKTPYTAEIENIKATLQVAKQWTKAGKNPTDAVSVRRDGVYVSDTRIGNGTCDHETIPTTRNPIPKPSNVNFCVSSLADIAKWLGVDNLTLKGEGPECPHVVEIGPKLFLIMPMEQP